MYNNNNNNNIIIIIIIISTVAYFTGTVRMINCTVLAQTYMSKQNFACAENKEMFYLMTHSAHFIYGYMSSGIWKRTTQITREETRYHHYMGYSFRLAARGLNRKEYPMYMHHPIVMIAHTTAYIIPVVEH